MSSNNEESSISSILSTFSLTSKNKKEEGRFEKLATLKKLLQKELNKSITVPECDAVLLAGALLLNDSNAVKEQSRLVSEINIRLWGNAVDPLSKWITQHSILPEVRNMNKFIEGNTPLHFAVLTGNFENIAFLLSKQADPFLKNAHGDKPLGLCQDYHRKLHGKGDKKRKRLKSLKKRQKKKSVKTESNDCVDQKSKGNEQSDTTPRCNSYDDDADDENDSDYYYNNNNNDDDNDSTSSSSSMTSHSPMHLSCREFDELFSNAVKQHNVAQMQSDKEGIARKTNKENKKIQKKAPTQSPNKNDHKKKMNVNNKNNKGKNNNKSKAKPKAVKIKKSKSAKSAKTMKNHPKHGPHKHGGYHGKNRYKNKRIGNHRRNGKKKNQNKKTNTNKGKNGNNNNKGTQNTSIPVNKPTLHSRDSISISSSSSTAHSVPTSSSSSDTDNDASCSMSDSTLDSDDSDDLSSSDDTHSDYSSSVTLSDSDSSSNLSCGLHTTGSSLEINIGKKNGKLITRNTVRRHSSDEDRSLSVEYVSSEYLSSSDDEIHITTDDEASSTMESDISISTSSETSEHDDDGDNDGNGNGNDDDDADNGAIKLLQESMEQSATRNEEKNSNDMKGETDFHSQLVPIIIALSEINIFAESASLARIVKFICTLIFFVALHWLEGNSAAKMIVKVGVSIIYLVAMFGHRINEWKECIDAETVLRKQQWTKQRDKERQKRKDRLQKTLRSPDSKRCVAKKQRKLERDTFYKQDIFDWRSRIRMMINHAESAFLQNKYGMAEIYFSRLLGFLMENDTDPHIFLNDRKRANLKINRRWKGVFDDHYSIPIAKMFSRRAYCLCKIKNGEYPHSAPANNSMYKSISGHLELAVNDLTIAISLRELSPLYQSFIKLYEMKSDHDIDIWSIFEKKLDRLLVIIAAQLCDLLSLAVLHDLNDKFEKAYANTLQADDVIHSLNKFNKEYIQSGLLMDIIKNNKEQTVDDSNNNNNKQPADNDNNNNDNNDNDPDNNESEMESKRILATIQDIQDHTSDEKHLTHAHVLDADGNFKLCFIDMIPLKDIEVFLNRKKNTNYKRSMKLKMVEENKVDDDNIKRSRSMISLYAGDMDHSDLDCILKHPLRQTVDLVGYKQLIGVEQCALKAQGIIDEQLKKIRLLRLQAANRQRAVSLRTERDKAKHNKLHDERSITKQSKKKENKKTKNNQKEKLEKLKIKSSKTRQDKNDDACVHNIDELKHDCADKRDDEISSLKMNALNPSTPSSIGSGTSTSLSMSSDALSLSNNIATTIMEYGASFSVIQSDKEDDDDDDDEETKMSMVLDNNNDNNIHNIDNKTNKNKIRKKVNGRSKIKLKKLKKKNKNKIGKKKTKKNQIKNNESKNKKKLTQNDDNDERSSISSEFSKSPEINTNTDIADEDDSLSTLSGSTSSESVKTNPKQKNVTNKHKKHLKSPTSMDSNHSTRNRGNRRSPKNKNYRKKVSPEHEKKGKDLKVTTEPDEEEPRQHWLWNINCDFWPNCRNSHQCAFKHPTDKGSVIRRRRMTPRSGDIIGKPIMCRFGRECSRIDCWFWHPGDDETFIDPNTETGITNKDNQSISSGNTDSIVAVNTDNSYELIDDTASQTEPQSILMDDNPSSSAVIISKKPITNPWHKPIHKFQDKTSPNDRLLSPTTFNNKKIASEHRSNTPSASVTVGTVYHNDYDIGDYNINNMVRSKKKKGKNNHNKDVKYRHRSSSNPVPPRRQKVPTYITPSGQKIQSSLNPHASAFNASLHGHTRQQLEQNNDMHPNSMGISPPFDPHSQRINGGVFTPHSTCDNGINAKGWNIINNDNDNTQTMRAHTPLGTHITNNNGNNMYSNDAYNPNSYPYDEYKQAPNNAIDHPMYYDYGDEAKVVEKPQDQNEDTHASNTSNNCKKKGASRPWICPSCSFLNEIGTTACDLCSSLPPDRKHKDEAEETEEESPLDFDFNVHDIMNNGKDSNDDMHHDDDDVDDEPIHRELSFNSLFFGNGYDRTDRNDRRDVHKFKVGDHVIHNDASEEPIQGIVAELRDLSESSYPIRIEYYTVNQFNKRIAQFMWVLPTEIIKVNGSSNALNDDSLHEYNDDELYDYDDVDDDDD